MADISKININSTTYDLKDEGARSVLNWFGNDLKPQLVSGYIAVGSVNIGDTVNFTVQSGSYKTQAFACSKGDIFIETGYLNANNPRLWAFTDSSKKLISKCDNKVTLNKTYLVAPSDGYAIFSFQASSEYELYKIGVKTDSTLTGSGIPADAKTVGDDLMLKRNICLSYCNYNEISWEVVNSACKLTVSNTIRVRYDTTDAAVNLTKADFLALANASALVTVSNGVVSGTHYALVFDFGTKTFKIVDTSTRGTFNNTEILFYYHYGIILGSLTQSKVTTDVLQNNSDIAELKAQVNITVADYFEAEAVDCRDKLIAECDEKSLVIAFTTDNHYGASNGANFPTTVHTIKKVNELYPVDLVIDGGDLINGDETKANAVSRISSAVNMLCGVKGNSFTIVGNHDDDSFTASETPLINGSELYAMMWRHGIKDLDDVGSTKPYGYVDYDSVGIRLIMLDSMYGTNGHDNSDWGYTDAELTWFTTKALNTTNQVVIFSHMAFTKEYSAYNTQVHNGAEMRQAVESFIANGGVCVGLFHGHTHWDFIGQYSQTNGFHEIATGCGRVVSGPITTRTDYYPSGATMPERTSDTVTQELWDIIVIKPESREVNMIRFGAGSDRSFTY